MTYTKNKSWDYVLNEDYVLNVPNVDFGKLDLFSNPGPDGGKLLATADVHTLTVKKGYAWDGCTGVPSYKWNLEASLVHDVLYQIKKCPGGEACKATWWQVDRLFLVMMKELGASWLQRNVYYAGVRVFGSVFKIEKLYNAVVIDRS